MIFIILAAGLPIVAAACFHFFVLYNADYKKTEQAVMDTARSIAWQTDSRVDGIHSLLTSLSQLPEVRNRNKKEATAIIRNILHHDSSSMNITLADLSGNPIASGRTVTNVGGKRFFRDALHTHRFSVGGCRTSGNTGRPALILALPVMDPAGNPIAVLYATFDLNQICRFFDTQNLPPNSSLNLCDSKGMILLHYPYQKGAEPGDPEMPRLRRHLAGPTDKGVFVDYGPDGVKRLMASERLYLNHKNRNETPYLFIRISTPENSVLAGVNRYIVRSALMFSLVALFAIALNHYLVGRLILSPIERMASVAGTIAKGDFSVRTGLENAGTEIGLLATSFDTMTAALDRRLHERLQAEAMLKAKEAQLEALINNLPFHLWAMHPDGRYFMQNRLSQGCWGDFIGKKPSETSVPKEVLNKWHHNNYRAFAGEVVKSEMEYDIDGERHFFYAITAPIKSDRSILGIMGVHIDINDRKSLESQLYQAQKMEAVGQLAGGIAHDFNNILTAIIGYAHFMSYRMAPEDPLYKYTGQILKCADRAAELTQGLLAFSRKQIMLPQIINLNDLVENQQSMLRMLTGSNIELKLDLMGEELCISADKVKIEQVLMNLLINAKDAMPDGGSIVISTSSMIVTSEFLNRHGYGTPGQYACISVRDTGSGMDMETQRKVFEPFFTTKEIGKGTGLGLAITYGIIKQHNGFINVYSEPGRGTVFNIYLPLVDEKAEPYTILDVKSLSAGGNETLLLAEDDPELGHFHKTLLEEAGYRVLTAVDGEEALTTFVEYEGEISLLILDVMMPGRNGNEVFDLARNRNREAKALFVSGYPLDALSDQGIILDEGLFVKKPITPGKLLEKVREAIEA